MYSNEVIRLFTNPENAGRISKPDGIADSFNEDRTAHIEFSLRIENGLITLCEFRAQAEPQIIAICSKITTMIKGKPSNMLLIDGDSIVNSLKVSQEDVNFCINCAISALQDYKEKLAKK